MKKETINERLRTLRTAAVKTQGEFANDIGISVSLYSKIETGEKEVTSKVIEKIVTSYHVPLNWLRDGLGEMKFTKPEKNESGNPWQDEAYRLIKEQMEKKDLIIDRLTQALLGTKSFHKVTNLPSLRNNRRSLVTKAA